jgi:DNA gyrase/topoisomerase IV subunit A
VRAIKLTRVRGTLVAARALPAGAEALVTSSDGIVIRMETRTISRQKRDATGVKVMNLAEGAHVSAFDLAPVDPNGG